jgi:uncharacterized protein (DUF39 family)
MLTPVLLLLTPIWGRRNWRKTTRKIKSFRAKFVYGGGHVIEDLVARKPVRLEATAYPTNCLPRKRIETTVTLDDLNEATLFNPRNCYQNYSCAVNRLESDIYTYRAFSNAKTWGMLATARRPTQPALK